MLLAHCVIVAGLLAQGCGAAPAAPPTQGRVTSSRVVEGLTAESFTALCDERGGTVEVIAHCGGSASAAGIAYDIETAEVAWVRT